MRMRVRNSWKKSQGKIWKKFPLRSLDTNLHLDFLISTPPEDHDTVNELATNKISATLMSDDNSFAHEGTICSDMDGFQVVPKRRNNGKAILKNNFCYRKIHIKVIITISLLRTIPLEFLQS